MKSAQRRFDPLQKRRSTVLLKDGGAVPQKGGFITPLKNGYIALPKRKSNKPTKDRLVVPAKRCPARRGFVNPPNGGPVAQQIAWLMAPLKGGLAAP